MSFSSRLVVFAVVLSVARGQTQDPAALRGLLPDEVLIAVEVATPANAVRELLAAAGGVPPGVPPEVLAPLGLGLTAASIAIGGDPVAFAERLAGGGLVLGFEHTPAGARSLVAARPGDVAEARRWCERHAAGKFRIEGDLLLMCAEPAGIDRLAANVGKTPRRWAAVDFGPAAAVRGAVDLAALRAIPGVPAQSIEKLGGGARFLLAPVMHALVSANQVRFRISGGERLAFDVEADASVRGTTFGALLPAGERPVVPPLPRDGLASMQIDRSLRVLLTEPARFLAPSDVLAVQSFLSIADAVDGARTSFVADLLGGLAEPFVLHVLPAAEQAEEGSPVVLPGVVLVARVAKAEVEEVLERTAQVLLTIGNAERMQRGQAPLSMRAQRTERGHGLVAEPGQWRGPGLPPFDSELLPTLWFEGGCVAFATTRAAAERVLGAQAEGAPDGDRLVLRGPAIADVFAANRGVLELARMLDEGEDPTAARRFFDVAIAVLRAVRELSFALDVGADATRLSLVMERVR